MTDKKRKEELKPGRDLDALVAEKVLGFEVQKFRGEILELRKGEAPINVYELGYYSSDISAAWEVVEKLGPDFNLHFQRWWTASICDTQRFGEEIHTAEAKTAPHAICLAALKAVGVEV